MKKAKIILLSLTLIGYLAATGCFLYGEDTAFYIAVACFTVCMVAFFIVAMIDRHDTKVISDEASEDAIGEDAEEKPAGAGDEMSSEFSEPEGTPSQIQQQVSLPIESPAEAFHPEVDVEELQAELAEAEAEIRELKAELAEVRASAERQLAEAAEEQKKSAQSKVGMLLPEGLKPKDELSTINIVDVAKSVADELREPALRAGLRVQVSATEGEIMVRADEGLLRVLFRNIVDNSIKYMNRQGNLVITLSTIGDDLFVVLKDNGEGLPEEETGHIFELNYQGSNRISGNGLGLAQAKAVVSYYGGNIYAKSVKGGGMGIYIQLPTL